ncbi:MAG: type-F conjugative transfer system protein TraW [Legionella sp.]|uniref:type-F conjugative transfer system protein TraW n=1 Tax=Legionella sp. TaxID=459 RepID=UPI0039E24560
MKRVLFLWLLLAQCSLINAHSLGVVGAVFPIKEKSFLKLIYERLTALKNQGAMEQLNQQWVKEVAAHANRPRALNLVRTMHSRHHYYVPELVLADAIKDSTGRTLYAKGTRVNALKQLLSYQPCWLFFNADDEAQIRWAKKKAQQCINPKYILTGGAISQAETTLNAAIYFDQSGRITQKLRITAVPTQVTRLDHQLVIHEVAIKENGDEA